MFPLASWAGQMPGGANTWIEPFAANPLKQIKSVPPLDAASCAVKEHPPTSVVPSAVVMLHVWRNIWRTCSLGNTVARPPVNSSCTFVTGSLALHLPTTGTTSVPLVVPLKSKLNFKPPLLQTATSRSQDCPGTVPDPCAETVPDCASARTPPRGREAGSEGWSQATSSAAAERTAIVGRRMMVGLVQCERIGGSPFPSVLID